MARSQTSTESGSPNSVFGERIIIERSGNRLRLDIFATNDISRNNRPVILGKRISIEKSERAISIEISDGNNLGEETTSDKDLVYDNKTRAAIGEVNVQTSRVSNEEVSSSPPKSEKAEVRHQNVTPSSDEASSTDQSQTLQVPGLCRLASAVNKNSSSPITANDSQKPCSSSSLIEKVLCPVRTTCSSQSSGNPFRPKSTSIKNDSVLASNDGFAASEGVWTNRFPLVHTSPYTRYIDEELDGGSDEQYRCLYKESGCPEIFQTPRDHAKHLSTCIYGLMYTCVNENCRGSEMNFYWNSEYLIMHACEIHGCLSSSCNYTDTGTASVILSSDFFKPPDGGYSAIFVQNFEANMDGDPVNSVLTLLNYKTQENPDGLVIVPIKYGKERMQDDSIVEFYIEVRGASGWIIPHSTDLTGLEESLDGSDGYTGIPATVDAYNSDRHFLERLDRDDLPTYKINDVKRYAIRDGNNLEILIKTKVVATRCVLQREYTTLDLPFGRSWKSLGLSPQVKDAMLDGRRLVPSALTKAIVPQIQGMKDIMLECLDEPAALSSIVGGVIQEVMGFKVRNKGKGVRAIVIMPTIHLLNKTFAEWSIRAVDCGLTAYEFTQVNQVTREKMRATPPDIVGLTLSQLELILDGPDDRLWDSLTKKLGYVYLHYPDRQCWARSIVIMRRFHVKLGSLTENIARIGYGPMIPISVRKEMYNNLFFRGSLFFSVGENPEDLITSTNFNRLSEVCLQDKLSRIGELVKHGRWLVLLSKTSQVIVDAVMTKLCENISSEKVILLKSEALVRSNPDFFSEFVTSEDAVVVGQYYVLDYDELKIADGIIMFETPYHHTDMARIALMARQRRQTFTRVHWFWKSQAFSNKGR